MSTPDARFFGHLYDSPDAAPSRCDGCGQHGAACFCAERAADAASDRVRAALTAQRVSVALALVVSTSRSVATRLAPHARAGYVAWRAQRLASATGTQWRTVDAWLVTVAL